MKLLLPTLVFVDFSTKLEVYLSKRSLAHILSSIATKEKIDLVDSDLKVLDVVSVFGPYVKFVVAEIGREEQNEGEFL